MVTPLSASIAVRSSAPRGALVSALRAEAALRFGAGLKPGA